MAGVVFAPSGGGLGRYGMPVTVAAGGVIPAGVWYVNGAWALVAENGTSYSMEAGLCVSDGVNATLTAAGVAIPLGQ